MQTYRVTWGIDIDAESPEGAARKAHEIMLDEHSIAVIFDITSKSGVATTLDLLELDFKD